MLTVIVLSIITFTFIIYINFMKNLHKVEDLDNEYDPDYHASEDYLNDIRYTNIEKE